jgi:hypothetical protein
VPKWATFFGPWAKSQSPVAACDELVNWYLARVDAPGARNPFAFYPTPGMQNAFNAGTAPIRGLFAQSINGTPRAWVVADRNLKEFDANLTLTLRNGAVPFLRDGNPVYMVTNAIDQLLISSGGHKYVQDLDTNVVTDQGSGVIGPVLSVDMLDGFGIALEASGFAVSAEDDFTSWDPTDFVQRNSASDQWRAMKVIKNRIYFVGEYTTDIYWDVGASPVPFAPIQGALIRYGSPAAASLTEVKGSLLFLAQDRYGTRTVQKASGYNSTKVSTEAIDYLLNSLTVVSDCEAFTYEELGVEFAVFNFPTANLTLAWDDVGGWHVRGTWNVARGAYDVWHPRCHCLAFDKHFYGDRTTDAVFQGSVAFGLDAGGAPLRRLRAASLWDPEHQMVEVNVLAMLFENGIGQANPMGNNPTVMLQKSTNAGRAWGIERWRHTGALGNYQTRTRWMNLGSGRDLAARVVVTDPIPWRIADALVNPRDEAR